MAHSQPPPEYKNVSQMLAVSAFYKGIGDELNSELDAFLPGEQLDNVDYCENLNSIAEYIECKCATSHANGDKLVAIVFNLHIISHTCT